MAIDKGRRRTLGLIAGGLAGAALGRSALAVPGPPPSPKSAPGGPVVVRARRPGLLGADASMDAAKLDDALGKAIARAAGEENATEAMRRLFRPTDVVGIKVNCIAGRGLSSRPEIAVLLARYLQNAGVPARRIVIWDRTDRELVGAGYTLAKDGSGVRVVGTDDDYDRTVRDWGPAASCFARFLTDEITALIDLAVLKDHHMAGVSLGMKNWYGAVQNPNKLHGDACQPYVAKLAAHPLIKDKLRLTVVDGSVGQCNAGPGRSPKWQWPYDGVIVSTDPVAVDAVGYQVLDARRREVGIPGYVADGREPVYIREAARLGLGVADLAKIRVEDV